MSFLVKGFPEISLYDFPTDRWSQYTIMLKQPLSSLPEDKDQLFEVLVKAFLKDKGRWDSENADEKRTLKSLPKISHTLEYEKGNGLMTFLSYTYSKRGKQVSTSVIENTLSPEYMDSPSNADFNQEYVDQSSKVYVDGEMYDLIAKGVSCDTVFAVEHKNRQEAPTVPCEVCHGSGFQKCPQCNGTGRESYVDGYYASGEERIKTGRCSECGGSGKVPCEECNGRGEIQIYAQKYSLVYSVKDTISKRSATWSYLPGDRYPSRCISSPYELEHKEFENSLDGAIDRSYLYQAHDALDFVRRNGDFTYVKKNNKSFLEDNRKEVEQIMDEDGLVEQYHEIVKREESDTGSLKSQRGDVVSRQEVSFVFPVIRLNVEYGSNYKFHFFLYDKKGTACVKMIKFYGMSFGERLKYRLLSLLKK